MERSLVPSMAGPVSAPASARSWRWVCKAVAAPHNLATNDPLFHRVTWFLNSPSSSPDIIASPCARPRLLSNYVALENKLVQMEYGRVAQRIFQPYSQQNPRAHLICPCNESFQHPFNFRAKLSTRHFKSFMARWCFLFAQGWFGRISKL